MLGCKIIHFKALNQGLPRGIFVIHYHRATISLSNFSKFRQFGKEIRGEISEKRSMNAFTDRC